MTSQSTFNDLRNILNAKNLTGFSNILGLIQNNDTIDAITNLVNNPNVIFYIPDNDSLKNVELSDLSNGNNLVNIIKDHIVVGNCTLSGKSLNLPNSYFVEAYQGTDANGNPGAGFQVINRIINSNDPAIATPCPVSNQTA